MKSYLDLASLLLAGFSLFTCVILIVAYLFFLPGMRKTIGSKSACLFLLLSILGLQFAHILYFYEGFRALDHRVYGLLLTLVPPSFYFFSRSVLFAGSGQSFRWPDTLHAAPPVLAITLPLAYLPPFAFTFGTIYTFWFARVVLKLRDHTQRFRFEVFFFCLFAAMALGALILGLLLPTLNPSVFYFAYANAISLALVLVIAALIFFPELLSDIQLISELAYTKSRLTDVDIDTKLAELDKLMALDKQFQYEKLSLNSLAEQMSLSSHQLSELINSNFGIGFPRYIREQRVKEAKRLLSAETKTSILAVSIETGFKSQSNFYTAFKEITGLSPGQFRKQNS